VGEEVEADVSRGRSFPRFFEEVMLILKRRFASSNCNVSFIGNADFDIAVWELRED